MLLEFGKPLPIGKTTCFLCTGLASTQEHVIPEWLQHRFDLWDQHLVLPNNTFIPYRQLTIPACACCNNRALSALEKKIESNKASNADIWRWANKVHAGLCYKDQLLAWDRKHPDCPIGQVIQPGDPLELTRYFLRCIPGKLRVQPDPFGSVFRFPFNVPQDFALHHTFQQQSVCISLGSIGYVVFIKDGQFLEHSRTIQASYKSAAKQGTLPHMLFFFAQCIEYMQQAEVTYPIAISDGLVASVGAPQIHNITPANADRFSALCKHLGIEIEEWLNEGQCRWRSLR